MRKFNTEGPVIPARHYCIPPLERLNLDEILELIRDMRYFVLHAPRQTGKTSALLALCDLLNSGAEGDFRCVYVNVEAAQAVREDVGRAMRVILGRLASRARLLGDGFLYERWTDILAAFGEGSLTEALTCWCQADPTPVVLLIDEIDSLIGDTLISVLRQLRDGYVQRPESFPHSIVLCGVRDVRDYRIRSISENATVAGGSAFNVRAESMRLGDFTEGEVRALLAQHTEETGQTFTREALATVWRQTRGQPWLVNALCRKACFDFETGRDRSRPVAAEDLLSAQEELILNRVTHLDQLADKLKEERVRRVIEPLLSGAAEHGFQAPDIEYVRDLGLIARDDPPHMANPIYAEVVPRELTYAAQAGLLQDAAWYVDAGGGLNVDALLADFQAFFREHSEHWQGRFAYAEAGPQLLLQAFLQRIAGGGGRIEREYGLGRGRTDLLIIWPHGDLAAPQAAARYVIECKVLHGGLERTIREGLAQTADYMDRCGAQAGHLVIFDRGAGARWEDKIFRRQEQARDGRRITVWGCDAAPSIRSERTAAGAQGGERQRRGARYDPNMRESWGGRNLIGISFLLALASCAGEVDDSRYVASEAQTFAQAQDAAPAISSISFGTSPARGDTYELGETVVVFVQFDGPVVTTDHGEFQMALTIGAETQYATLVGWRSDHRYRFEYTVQEPDRDEDGISIPADAILLNGGTLTAPDGTTDADLTHGTVAADAGRKMNGSLTSLPAVTSIEFVSAPKGNAYALGEAVEVAVRFDRVVTVTGNPQVALTIGTETRHAAHSAWWRDEDLIFFSYKVQGDDRDEDGISIPADALILNGGTITATDGTTDADLTHAPLGPDRDRKVDGGSDVTPPRVKAIVFDTSPARGDTYELGETVKMSVEFDGPIEAGTFQLALTIGTETRYATLFATAIGRHWYYFEYTVQEGDRDEDGISIPANALILISGAVTDPSGTVDADLTHGTVAADAGRKVNGSLTSPPAVKRVYLFSSPPTKGDIYGTGETVRVGVRFDRVVTVTGNPQVALTIGTETRHAAYSASFDRSAIAFAYVVQEGDRDEDGISIPANALILNGGTIKFGADSTIDADLTHAAVARDPIRKVRGSTASP